jgi:isopenicillin-N N-acyltransferase-like protein
MAPIFSLLVAIFVLLNIYISVVNGAYCNGSPAAGERVNQYPIFDGQLRHIRSVPNAMLFHAGPLNTSFPVVHVWGTPYEVGFAQGTLMKTEIIEFVTATWAYLNSEVVEALSSDRVPEWVKRLIVNKGMNRALDWTAQVTAPFTPQAYYDELHGLADATGLDYKLLLRLNMFPELTKAQCSFFGAWGTAVG